MSYIKRQIPHLRIVRVIDRNGDTLYPTAPAPMYRCEDRARRLPSDHPMAIRNVTPAPPLAHQHYLIVPPAPILRGELTARVCAAIAWVGMALVVIGVISAVGWI